MNRSASKDLFLVEIISSVPRKSVRDVLMYRIQDMGGKFNASVSQVGTLVSKHVSTRLESMVGGEGTAERGGERVEGRKGGMKSEAQERGAA